MECPEFENLFPWMKFPNYVILVNLIVKLSPRRRMSGGIAPRVLNLGAVRQHGPLKVGILPQHYTVSLPR